MSLLLLLPAPAPPIVHRWTGAGLPAGTALTSGNVNNPGNGDTIALALTGTTKSAVMQTDGVLLKSDTTGVARFDAPRVAAGMIGVNQTFYTPLETPTLSNLGIAIYRSVSGSIAAAMHFTDGKGGLFNAPNATVTAASTPVALVVGHEYQVDTIVVVGETTALGRAVQRWRDLTDPTWNTTGDHYYDSGYTLNLGIDPINQSNGHRFGKTTTATSMSTSGMIVRQIGWAELAGLHATSDRATIESFFMLLPDTVVVSDPWVGSGAFTGDALYSNVAGTAPSYVAGPAAVPGAGALRFPAGVQSIVQTTGWDGSDHRGLDRFYRLSGAATAVCEIMQVRTDSARGPGIRTTATNHLQIVDSAGATILWSGSAALPVGGWFRVGWEIFGRRCRAFLYADETTTTPLETSPWLALANTTGITTVRDGNITSTGPGAGVTLDVAWPVDMQYRPWGPTRPAGNTAAGAVTWAGAAAGVMPVAGGVGSADGSVTFGAGTSAGSAPNGGTAAGAVTWAAAGTGSSPTGGTAAGTVALSGTSAGAADLQGTATGTVLFGPGAAAGPAATVPTLVKQATAGGALTSQPVPITATTTGNTLILLVAYATGTTNAITGVTDNAGNTWAKAAEGWQSGSNTRAEIWYALNALSVTTVTVAKPSSANAALNLSEWAGIASASAFDVGTGVGEASSTSKTAGPVTTTNPVDLVITMLSYPSSTITATLNTAGFTALTGGVQGTQAGRAAYQVVTATGSYSVNWTMSAAVVSGNAIAAFKGSPSAGGAGSAAGAVQWNGTSSGGAALQGAAAGTVQWDGTAAGQRSPAGTVAGAVQFGTGAASGSIVTAGTAAGTVVFGAGTAAGSGATRSGTASGAFSYDGAAAGAATMAGTASGTVTFAGTVAGARAPAGTVAGTVTYVGSAAGSTSMAGAAAGAVTFAGSAAGARVSAATVTGGVTWAGLSSGSAPTGGTATGAVTWAGAATGSVMTGTVTGAFSFTGTAAGQRSPAATAAGAVQWDGTAAGVAPVVAGNAGTADGTVTWAGTAAGSRVSSGTASGAVAWAGAAASSAARAGTADGTVTWAGSAAGGRLSSGTTSGAAQWAGAALGTTLRTGTATGTITVGAGAATGVRTPQGQATGQVTWTGTNSGERSPAGQVAGGVGWAGLAAGAVLYVGAAAGTLTLSGTALGTTLRTGTAAGDVAWAGTSSGARPADGTAAGTVTWSGAAAGLIVTVGSAAGTVGVAGFAVGTSPTFTVRYLRVHGPTGLPFDVRGPFSGKDPDPPQAEAPPVDGPFALPFRVRGPVGLALTAHGPREDS